MDVSIQDWPDKFLPLLSHISNALFVAIDFEISGISMKKGTSGTQGWQQQTLQQRYEVVKGAAEKYQILQVGITTVIEDERIGGYILRPYNIHLSPLLKEPLGIDRSFSMQSSSIAFLQNHGFILEKPFTIGVPYLSRHEEAQALAEDIRANGGALDLTLLSKVSNPTQQAFVIKIRTEIMEWLGMEEKANFLNVGPDYYDHTRQESYGFTSNERQLIHELVKVEFPRLASHNHPGYIRIDYRNEEKEKEIAVYNTAILQARLHRQIGLRYLFDGMISSQNLSHIDILSCFQLATRPKSYTDQQRIVRQFEEVKLKLQRPTVLVGHNIFTDLVNFYACFIGPLPERVEDFQMHIHNFFPLVIDTKYLASQTGNTTGLRSSLTELDFQLRDMPLPMVQCHAHHAKYASEQYFGHEAGYDSYITARVLIKLAAKLEALNYHSSIPETQPAAVSSDLLGLYDEDDPNDKVIKSYSEELAAVFNIDLGTSPAQKKPVEIQDAPKPDNFKNIQVANFIPGLNTPFWQLYGNRLMVNGTIENICLL